MTLKNTLITTSSILIMLTANSGCHKAPAAKTTSTHFLNATSGSISTFSATGSMVSAGGTSGAKITIDGSSPGGDRFLVFINPYSGTTGIRTISGTMIGCEFISGTSGSIISSVHGTISLTSVSPDLIGTFSFTGTDSSIYSGSFNVAAP